MKKNLPQRYKNCRVKLQTQITFDWKDKQKEKRRYRAGSRTALPVVKLRLFNAQKLSFRCSSLRESSSPKAAFSFLHIPVKLVVECSCVVLDLMTGLWLWIKSCLFGLFICVERLIWILLNRGLCEILTVAACFVLFYRPIGCVTDRENFTGMK